MSDTRDGTRSWWNGTIATICGRTLPAHSRYQGGRATYPECQRLRAQGVKWGK